MAKITTHNIEISAVVNYWNQQSIPKENHYFFVYFITITNNGNTPVQLLRRHWDIFDSNGEYRKVDGEGVVGETPVIEPGQSFEYNSGCNLCTDMGCMEGYYTVMRLDTGEEFRVNIPRFEMVVPAKLN